ncbi:MAG TPA: histidine kinase dimerization/phospho-acceptor domain-containing protein, partial [Terriglobales bacterium]
MTFRRHWWVFFSATLILGYSTLALSFPKNSPVLTAIGNLTTLLLMVFAVVAAAVNAVREKGQTRIFWALLGTGYLLWAVNQGMWTVYEVFLGREIPDPFVGDVILFVHIVPLMAAVALRVDQVQEEKKLHLGTLNFVMLLIWWVFLYAFIVFPDEYVVLNRPIYARNYDRLYVIENWVLLGVLAVLTLRTRGGWRKVYRNLLIGCGMYSVSSVVINAAIERQNYYTGSPYDIPLLVSVCWLIWTSLEARDSRPAAEPVPASAQRWESLPPRLAMVAMLSAPLMGCWALWVDTVPQRLHFRLLVVLIAMLVLGVFIFLRQYLLDRELLRLLEESRSSLANLQRAQNQLLQKEKLASLGQLVSGVAHEINNPLAAILGYSELLASGELNVKQAEMARKIGQQARRTRDLVSRMLNFAQQ